MKVSQAVKALLPGVMWTLRNEDLTTLVVPQGVTPPTQNQVDAYIAAHNYYELRAKEYPPTTDLNDALVHQAAGDNGVALAAYLAACQAVKNKYPKPG